MKVHEPVIVYTHNQSNYNHSTDDSFAIVLADKGNGCVSVVRFPVGGPVIFEDVCEFNEDACYAGNTYWREMGSEPPDFSGLDYAGEPEWNALCHRQEIALANENNPKKRDELIERQRAEREELRKKFDEHYQRQRGEVEDA